MGDFRNEYNFSWLHTEYGRLRKIKCRRKKKASDKTISLRSLTIMILYAERDPRAPKLMQATPFQGPVTITNGSSETTSGARRADCNNLAVMQNGLPF
jgi:hypothetical protein